MYPGILKLIIGFVVGYALSPIDITFLGYIDDIILLTIGIMIALKTIPDEVLVDLNATVEKGEMKKSWLAGTLIILLWVIVITFTIYKLVH